MPLCGQGVGQECPQDSDLEPSVQGDGSTMTRGGEPRGKSLVLDPPGNGIASETQGSGGSVILQDNRSGIPGEPQEVSCI